MLVERSVDLVLDLDLDVRRAARHASAVPSAIPSGVPSGVPSGGGRLRGEQPNARATDGVTKRHEPASRALVTAPVVTPVGRRLC
jgi:hypothetical protein